MGEPLGEEFMSMFEDLPEDKKLKKKIRLKKAKDFASTVKEEEGKKQDIDEKVCDLVASIRPREALTHILFLLGISFFSLLMFLLWWSIVK